MASYVVFESPHKGNEPAYVRDSFRWLAFLVPLPWFLCYRLWIEAALVFAAMIAAVALEEVHGFRVVVALLSFFLALALGFEAPALRMAALRRRGWKETGVVDAADRGEAEIRYLKNEAHEEENAPPRPLPVGGTVRNAATTKARQSPALGLLNYPGRH